MKNIFTFLLLLAANLFPFVEIHGITTGTATVSIRPSYSDIRTDTSQGAVLITLSAYSTNDARYRLFNGSNQYACWNSQINTFVSSASYSLGPPAMGNSSTTSTFWIVYQRGMNVSTLASYRDRIGPAYSANNNTVVLPASIAIGDSFVISGSILGTEINSLTKKYVILAWSGTNLVSASSSALQSGTFSILLPTGLTIDKIEVRTIENLRLAEVTGNWSSFSFLSGIQLTDQAIQDTRLCSINIDGKNLNGFSPGTKNYIVELPAGSATIPLVEASACNQLANVAVSQAIDLSGDESARTATIAVSAEDGITSMIYKITFVLSLPGKDAFLQSLLVNSEAVEGFNPATYIYKSYLRCGINSVPAISYSLSDSNATAIVVDATNINGTEEQRTSEVIVLAQDGVTTSTYKVIFEIYIPGTNSALVNLSVDSITIAGFDPALFQYEVMLPSGTANIPSIGFVTSDNKATAILKSATDLAGNIVERTSTVTVTAEDGSVSSSYTLLFTVTIPGNDALLSEIKVSGSMVSGFTPGTFYYEELLPYGTMEIPVVTFSLSDPKASASVSNAINLSGTEIERTSVISVTAEDRITTNTYYLLFRVKQPGTVALLTDLAVNGSSLIDFSMGKFDYSVILPFRTTIVPAVICSKLDPNSSFLILDAVNLTGTETERTSSICVTAEDGVTKSVYRIVFSVYIPGSDAFLSDLTLNGSTVQGFTMGKFDYTIILPYRTTEIPIVAYTRKDEKSSAVIENATNLTGSQSERTSLVRVIAEDGISISDYKIEFAVSLPGTIATLTGMYTDGQIIESFVPEIFNYEIHLPAGSIAVPKVTFIPADTNATALVTEAINLTGSESERTTTIVITAEDGISSSVYKAVFSIYIPGNNALLSDLSLNCSLVDGFLPDKYTYFIVLPFGTNRVPTVTFNLSDYKASAVLINAGSLTGSETERTSTVIVTAEDGTTQNLYSVVFSLDIQNGTPGSMSQGISLFPNPALNQLTITGLAKVNRLDIIDPTGKVVRRIEITGNEITIDISNLSNGIYFLRTESQTLKFIKEQQ
jgi:hypothetical protein